MKKWVESLRIYTFFHMDLLHINIFHQYLALFIKFNNASVFPDPEHPIINIYYV